MDKLLTIIIPSYNMEKLLDKCVGSVVACENIADIEAMIVNDGSTDGTSAVAHRWADECPGSVRVIDKENGGHGSGINVGLDAATGRYFKVLDADDWVDTAELDKLVGALRRETADCIICDFTEVYEATSTSKLQKATLQFSAGEHMPLEAYVSKREIKLHAVTFATEKYRSAGIRMREKCFYDDAQYCLYGYDVMESCACYPFNVYQYRLGREGQSVSPQGFLKHLDDHQRVMIDLFEYYERIKAGNVTIADSLLRAIGGHLSYEYAFVYDGATKEQLASTKEFDRRLRADYGEAYRLLRFGKRAKILKLLRFGYAPLKIVRKLTGR